MNNFGGRGFHFQRLDRLILADIVGLFLGAVLLFSGLFFAGDSLTRLTEFIQGGESWVLVGQLVLYTFPMILSMTAPMGMLLATLLGMGRLSGDSEIIALSAAGISFPRMMVPIFLFSLCVAIPWIYLNQTIVPAQNHARQEIIDAVKKKGGAGMSTRNPFSLTMPLKNNNSLTIEAQGGVDFGATLTGRATMYDIAVLSREKGKVTRIVTGDRADWILGTKNWKISGDVWSSARTPATSALEASVSSDELTLTEVGTPEEVDSLSHPESELTTVQLRDRIALLRRGKNEKDALGLEVEIARRIAMPLATVVFALVGAPLGVSSRREGKGMGFAYAVGITFAYWMSQNLVIALAKGGNVPPVLAMNLPNIIGLIMGLVLIRRVLR